MKRFLQAFFLGWHDGVEDGTTMDKVIATGITLSVWMVVIAIFLLWWHACVHT